MSSPETSPAERLERLVSRALGEQPLQRAPESLATRVAAAIAASASRRYGFAQWPLIARLAFPIACLALTAVTSTALVRLAGWATSELSGPLGPPLATARTAARTLTTLGELGPHLANALPPGLLEGALAIGVALYAALFGLSALAYRALRPRH
jgi:hypothetical protein